MKSRNLILRLHGSIGILMGLLLLVISLSGSAIVFHEELDHTLNQSLWSITPQSEQISPDTLLSTVQAAFPQLPVQSVRIPQQTTESYVFEMQTTNGLRFQTFVNPHTGKILGSRIWEHSLSGFFYTLHHDLFIGQVGTVIVGITGILFILMAITGTMLWTGWRKLSSGFKIRWKSPLRLLSYDLHKVSGIVSNVFLFIISFTGVIIVVFHLLPILGHTTETPAVAVPQQTSIALSELLRKADAAMPDGKTTFVGLPNNESHQVTVTKKLPDQQTGRFDFSNVALDRYSSEVLQVNKVVKPNLMFKFLIAIAELHFGTFGGLPTRILYMLVGFVPLMLFLTGLVIYRHRYRATSANINSM